MSTRYETGNGRLTAVGYYTPGRVFLRQKNREYVKKTKTFVFLPLSTYDPNVSVSEQFTISDSFTATVVLQGTVSESIAFSDTKSATAVLLGTVTETLTLADAKSALATYNATISESLGFSDSDSGEASYRPSILETITFGDAVNGDLPNTDVSENFTLSDSFTATMVLQGSVSENLTLSDTESALAVLQASVVESITLDDTESALVTFYPTVTESLNFQDTDSNLAVFQGLHTESYTLSDVVTVVTPNTETIEQFTISDSFSATMMRYGTVSESFTLSDTKSSTLGYNLTVSESLTLSDTVTATQGHQVTVSEQIDFTTGLSTTAILQASLQETIALSDSPSATAILQASIIEAVVFEDQLVVDFNLVLVYGHRYSIDLASGVRIKIAGTSAARITLDTSKESRVMVVHERAVGDTLLTLGVTLERDGTPIVIGESDTVKFEMVSECGVVKIAETEVGIQYTDRPTGKIDFQFLDSQVDTEGVFYGYFTHYASGKGERAPYKKNALKIIFYGP